MAAPVPTQLLELLRYAKRVGEPFDAAWELALELIEWPESRREETSWRSGLEWSREGWRASYEGWSQERRESALDHLSRAHEELSEAA